MTEQVGSYVDQTTMASRTLHGGVGGPGEGALTRLTSDHDALAVILDRFAAAFTSLSSLLVAAPDATRLDRVRDEELIGDWPLRKDLDGRRGVDLLHRSALAAEGAAEVRRDYNRLFFGPGPVIASPYESVYRSEEHLVFELQTLQVREAYAGFGLSAPMLNKEPDDHIGLEMGFLGALCVQAMDAIDAGDDAELKRLLAGVQSFLELHLLVWGPRCLDLAASGSQTLFYQGVAAMGLGALRSAKAAFLPAIDSDKVPAVADRSNPLGHDGAQATERGRSGATEPITNPMTVGRLHRSDETSDASAKSW